MNPTYSSLNQALSGFNTEYAVLKSIQYFDNRQCLIILECPIYLSLTLKNCFQFVFSNNPHNSTPVYLIEILFDNVLIIQDDISFTVLYQSIDKEAFEYDITTIEYSDTTFNMMSDYENNFTLQYDRCLVNVKDK